MLTKVSSCGKAILVGEHAVVYGARAVALPLKKTRMDLQGFLAKQSEYGFRCFEGENLIDPLPFDVLKFLEEACSLVGVPNNPLCLEVNSQIMIGSGLGSSASLSVSLVKFLSELHKIKQTPMNIARLANQLERTFHGKPSGLDTATIAFEEVILFEKEKDVEVLQVSLIPYKGTKGPWPFVLIDTEERMPTHLMIKMIRSKFEGPQGERRISVFNQVSDQVAKSLGSGNVPMMVEAMNQSSELLNDLGVVTPKAFEISKTLKKNGALSVKITGSGGGGCLLALLNPEKQEEQFNHMVSRFGSKKVLKVF